LLVDIGVNVFLTGSQVDVRPGRPTSATTSAERFNAGAEDRRSPANSVVSRRALIEAERAEKKAQLLPSSKSASARKGIGEDIAEFWRVSSISAASTACCTSPT